MQRCRYQVICTEIKQTLRHCGSRHDVIFDACPETVGCNVIVDVTKLLYSFVSLDTADQIETTVQKILGKNVLADQSTVSLISTFQKTPFMCPELGIEIRRPCEVRSCSFWTPREWTRNCIIFYMVDQERDSLDFKEISFLLNLDGQSVRKRWNTAIATSTRRAMEIKIRQAQQENVEKKISDTEIRGKDQSVCTVCGSVCRSSVFMRGGFSYCGRKCYERRSPVELRLEQEFNIPIQRILQVCRASFYTRRAMRHALGVNNFQLETLCEAHQIDISHFV